MFYTFARYRIIVINMLMNKMRENRHIIIDLKIYLSHKFKINLYIITKTWQNQNLQFKVNKVKITL